MAICKNCGCKCAYLRHEQRYYHYKDGWVSKCPCGCEDPEIANNSD